MGLTTQQMIAMTRDGFEQHIAGQRVKPLPQLVSSALSMIELLRGAADSVSAVSPKRGASFSYSIAGGADAADFDIDPINGTLTIQSLGEQGAEMQVIVRTTDTTTGAVRDTTLTVTITEDVNGGGTGVIETSKDLSIDEGATGAFLRLEGSGVVSWSVLGGADAAQFQTVGSFVEFLTPPDHDSPTDADANNVYVVRFGGYDSSGTLIAARDFAITVNDVTTQPYIEPDQTFTVSSLAPAGTVVGTVQAWVDEGLTAQSFTITGGPGASLFAINASTGVLTVDADLSSADTVGNVAVTVSDGTNTSDALEVVIEITAASFLSIEPSAVLHQPVTETIVAINCGGPQYTHSDGTVYEADTENSYFTSGAVATNSNDIGGTADDVLYQTERYGSTFWYDIPVPGPGLYKITLHLAETFFSADEAREFTVRFENGNADDYTTPAIDIHKDGGGQNVAYDYVRQVYIDGSSLDLDFVGVTQHAKVNGIRIEKVSGTAIAAGEGDAGSTNFVFNVVRNGVTTGASTVQWAVSGIGGNPATASDFVGGVLPSGTVSFSAGELVKQIIVQVQGDETSESPETFEVRLSNASAGSVITQDVATATINDDDFSGPTYRYFLVDTDTDAVLTELIEGQTLSHALVGGRNLSIYATATNVSPGSARLQLDAGTARVESVAPYSLYGDTGGGTDFLSGQPISAGAHTLSVIWYDGAGATGSVIESTSLNFVVAAPTGGVTLVNTNSAQAIELGEKTPIGARLPLILDIQGAPSEVYWYAWEMVADPDDMFEAVNRGVALKRKLSYAQKTSHSGTVRVTMRDGSTGDFPFVLSVVPFTGDEYYVATTGNDANAGTSGAPFLTLSKLASVLTAGDVGHVKAGNYGTQRLAITASGTFAQPIVVSGYQTIPGDDPTYATWDETSHAPNTALMPCIDAGGRNNNLTGLLAGGQHVFITNFTERQNRTGAYVTANWSGMRRIYTDANGRTDTTYSGSGVATMSAAWYTSLSDCHSVDAGAQGITTSGAYGCALDCSATCGDNTYATDYYVINIGDYGTIRRCFQRRAANVTSHGGHGMQSKTGSNCLIEDGEIVNCAGSSGFRHAEASYGVMRRFTQTGDNGPTCRDGAHDCIVEQGTVDGAVLGIVLSETWEADAGNPGNYSAVDCIFQDMTIRNCSYAIATSNEVDQAPVTAKGNTFRRLTIENCVYLFLVRHEFEADNVLRDSALTNVPNYAAYPSFWGQTAANNKIQVINCTGVPAP